MKIPTAIGDRSADNTDYRDQLMVNRTLVVRDIKDDQGYHLSHDGLTQHANAIGIDRGAIWNARQQSHLRISAQALISVDGDGVVTTLGNITGTDQASLPYSFQTQGILANTRFYLYDGTTLAEVTDPDLGAPIDAEWINGVYFFTDGETLYHTRADNEAAIDPLTFATAELFPDRTLGVLKNVQNQMIVFDRYSTQYFADGGGDNFRFRPIQGKSIKTGIAGTHCKTELDGKVYILGNRKKESPSIHEITSGRAITIATREIDKILETYTEIELALAVLESRVKNRDKVLIVRLARHTLEYNLTIATRFGDRYGWTIVKSDVTGDNPWRGANGIYDPQISQWVYGDSIDGRLGILDNTTNLQYGEQIEEIFYTPIINLESKSISQMELDTLPGFAAAEVNVFFSMSFDGVTHGTEFSLPVSRVNDYNIRLIARNIGYIRHNFSFKFRIVANGRTALSNLEIEHD